MNRKTLYRLEELQPIAEEIKYRLMSATNKIEIAGSMKRKRPIVRDIDIVLIPRDGVGVESALSKVMLHLLNTQFFTVRYTRNGRAASYGDKIKYVKHVNTGVPVDIYVTEPKYWGMLLLARTGPKEFNMKLWERLKSLGMLGHISSGVEQNGTILECPDEQTVFDLAQWPYVKPELRDEISVREQVR